MSDIRVDDRRRMLASSGLALAFWILVSLTAGFLPWEAWMLSKDMATSILVTLEDELSEPEPPPETIKVEPIKSQAKANIEAKPIVQPETIQPKAETKPAATISVTETSKPETAREDTQSTESSLKTETASPAFADNPAPKAGQKVEVKSSTSGTKTTQSLSKPQTTVQPKTSTTATVSPNATTPVEGSQAARATVPQKTQPLAPTTPENIKADPGTAPNPRSTPDTESTKPGVSAPRTGGKTDENLLAVKDDSPNKVAASGSESKTPGGILPSGQGSQTPQRNAPVSQAVKDAAQNVKAIDPSKTQTGGQPGAPGGEQGDTGQGTPDLAGPGGMGSAEVPDFGEGPIRGPLGKLKSLPTTVSAAYASQLPPAIDIEISFTVKDSGIVVRSSIQFDPPLPRSFEEELRNIIAGWRFQKGSKDGLAKFTYTIKSAR